MNDSSASARRSASRVLVFGAIVTAMLAWNGAAYAEDNVVTISEVTIVGRIQKPIAAVDVSRIQPKLTLGELRQPFLHRITEAVYRAPF